MSGFDAFADAHTAFRSAYAKLSAQDRAEFDAALVNQPTARGGMSATDVERYLGWVLPDFVSLCHGPGDGRESTGVFELLIRAREAAGALTPSDCAHVIGPAEDASSSDPFVGLCAAALTDVHDSISCHPLLVDCLLHGGAWFPHAFALMWRLHAETDFPVHEVALASLVSLPVDEQYCGCVALGSHLMRVGDATAFEALLAFVDASPSKEVRSLMGDVF